MADIILGASVFLFLALLLIVAFHIFDSIDNTDDTEEDMEESEDAFIDDSVYIVVDNDTGVQYLISNYGMCVRVDSSGKPLLDYSTKKIEDKISDNTDEKLIDEL